MNLDELQSIQSRERQASSLQNLRPSFYQDAGEFVRELTRERDRAAERADDPFSSREVRRLSDDIETAESTVEAIYERRVGKVVKMASIAAAGMPTEDDGLTEEERGLFASLVERIEQNREHVLDGVLEGEASTLSCSRDAETEPIGAETPEADSEPTETVPSANATDEPTPESSAVAELGLDPTPESVDETPTAPPNTPSQETDASSDGVSAAEMMGDGEETTPSEPATDDRTPPASTHADAAGDATAEGTESTEPDEPASTDTAIATADDSGGSPHVERTTVRITRDVGEVFGVDERSYELSSEDVVSLPAENVEPLVKQNAAEPLE
ncbi:hypothetical protein BRD16_08980 [Halobacteriales archaeon SW_6_65_46]|nr:MAG: hypothetical protein BRD16_08980 [Halobacteriales archaeon SW_6_65_46]